MRPKKIVLRTFIRHPIDDVFQWHLRKQTFLHGFPSWRKWVPLIAEELEANQVRYSQKVKFGVFKWSRFKFRVLFDHQKTSIRVILEKGPFRVFHLNIELRAHSIDAVEMVERIEYLIKMPLFFRDKRERKKELWIRNFFNYYHETLSKELDFFGQYRKIEMKKILISGASGMIGRNLGLFLQRMGHRVFYLTRNREDKEDVVFFDDKTGEVDQSKLEGFDIVVHLRGKGILGRWTKRRKNEMVRSRIDSTKKLAHHLALLANPPKVFLSASAVGYYGDCGEQVVDEKSEVGAGFFLSELVNQWEAATQILVRKNVRVVYLRFGMVLSMQGGALPDMVWPVKWGIAGSLGDGNHWQSWISLDDAVAAISHCIFSNEIAGAVNIVAPYPVRNAEMAKSIADHFNKQLGPKVPTALIRAIAGQMGEEVLLSSTRAVPSVLSNTGFRFRYPTIKEALKRLLRPLERQSSSS